jgi:hypothetical protein
MPVRYTPPTPDQLLPVPGVTLGTAAAKVKNWERDDVLLAVFEPGIDSIRNPSPRNRGWCETRPRAASPRAIGLDGCRLAARIREVHAYRESRRVTHRAAVERRRLVRGPPIVVMMHQHRDRILAGVDVREDVDGIVRRGNRVEPARAAFHVTSVHPQDVA